MPGNSSSPRLTLAVLATVVAAFSMLQSLVSPALPVIQHDLGQVGIALEVRPLTNPPPAPPTGRPR